MRAKGTSKAAFDRMERVSAILALRYSGKSLAEIGAEQVPPVSAQAIHALIQRALGQIPQSATADIRLLECNRLDMLQASIWPAAMLGDIAAIDRVLAIMKRRAQMLGLDVQPGYFGGDSDGDHDPGVVRVEIIGNPEPQRMKWLESEVQRLRELEAGIAPDVPPSTTLN